MRAHAVLLRAPADLSEACPLPMYDLLRGAHAQLRVDSATPVQDLSPLLSGSTPPAQRVLSEGVWDRRQAAVRGLQPDDRERARVCSAAGQHAGAWLGAMPVSQRLRALPRMFQLGLCMRLGAPISDVRLLSGPVRDVCVATCMMRAGGTPRSAAGATETAPGRRGMMRCSGLWCGCCGGCGGRRRLWGSARCLGALPSPMRGAHCMRTL